MAIFQPTLPARGATLVEANIVRNIPTFQPTLPARGATNCKRIPVTHGIFQPTLPARGATLQTPRCKFFCYFNPRSPHGERQESGEQIAAGIGISTHAPRTGSDAVAKTWKENHSRISTHAPRTGSDCGIHAFSSLKYTFQPTLPARGATFLDFVSSQSTMHHFNPRSPHGERREP